MFFINVLILYNYAFLYIHIHTTSLRVRRNVGPESAGSYFHQTILFSSVYLPTKQDLNGWERPVQQRLSRLNELLVPTNATTLPFLFSGTLTFCLVL